MLLCPQLGSQLPRQRYRARIRKRQKHGPPNQAVTMDHLEHLEEQLDHPNLESTPSHSHSYSQSPSQSLTLARITAAALTTAAMLHSTQALATTSSPSSFSSSSGSGSGGGSSSPVALPLQGTATPSATPASHYEPLLNATMLSSTLSSLAANDSGFLNPALAEEDWFDQVVLFLKGFVMLFIIIAAICGNLLVIISVMRVRKLRCVYVMFERGIFGYKRKSSSEK